MLFELGDALSRVGFGTAAILGWHLAAPSRTPSYRPTAFALSLLFAADGARSLLRLFVLAPARAAGRVPFEGPERVLFHVDQALLVLFPVMSVVIALVTFHQRRALMAATAAVWPMLVATLVLHYPALRGPALLELYARVHVAAALVQAIAAAAFFLEGRAPAAPQRIALLLLASDIAQLIEPWLSGNPARDWYIRAWPSAIAWGAVLVTKWRALRWTSSSRQVAVSSPSRSRSLS